MTLEQLGAKVRNWDLKNSGSSVANSHYQAILDQLYYHASKEWRVYLPAEHPDFNSSYMERLATWVGNLADEADQQLLLEYALHISFFSHDDFSALYRTAFDREIISWVAAQIGARLQPAGYDAFQTLVLQQIHSQTWFCPVTDSMDINEFYKVNHLKGVGHRPGFSTLRMLAETAGIPNPALAANLISYMGNPSLDVQNPAPTLDRLVLLEDVVGSGTQCLESVRWAVRNLAKPVLFVPLILCPNGTDALRAEEKQSNGRLTVRPVVELRCGDLLGPERQGQPGWPISDKVEDLARRSQFELPTKWIRLATRVQAARWLCFRIRLTTLFLLFTTSHELVIGSHSFRGYFETDMNITINPFQQLYFSDDTQTETTFVELFSDQVLQTAIHPVFQGGNVVLSGAQGCGKTMILSLLRPETRMAYSKLNRPFPVNKQMRNFISAGVNLTRSRITDIVQVTLSRGEETDEREMPFYFADFFNYLVVADLIKSVETIGSNPGIFDSIVDLTSIERFVKALAEQDCWFGTLDGVGNIDQLKKRIGARIDFYRRWVNGNLSDECPPESIGLSKTNIGEPIARTAECLRQSGLINDDIPVLIRVDQIEEMHRAFTERQRRLLLSFRKMLNRVFAARDARVHYRAGTRRYGWNNPDLLGVWGSDARLENRRDYHLIEMDEELFALGESKNSIFERFSVDAFQKRVAYYFRNEVAEFRDELAKSIFGKSPVADERLAQLNINPDPAQIDRALGLDSAIDGGNWTEEWRIIRKLYLGGHAGMLDAILAAAWGRQTGGARFKRQHRESPPPSNAPWRNRKWWRKERLDQAVLQLMTRCQQRFMWWGYGDIRSLSGGNITVFLHICHRIWDGFLKDESSLPDQRRTDILDGGTVDYNIQAAGILFASNEWFNKLPEEPGGNARQTFVERLGRRLNHDMMNDMRMAYPGGNGISIAITEFNSEAADVKDLRNFIRDAVGYGVLFATEHSSKSKAGGRRMKLYLNPILCPRFQIPESRTKEPYYWNIDELFELAKKAKITLSRVRASQPTRTDEPSLFPGFDGGKP